MKKITLLFSLLCLVCVNNSFAQITLDGTLDAGYTAGCAQVAPTQFGNSNISQTTWANGSEIDGIYYFSDGTNLYIMLTGNLETNYNKLEVFVDATAGGQNTLLGNNSGIDFGGLLRQTGLTFDSDFTADYWFSLTNGYDGVGYASYINFADLPTAGNGTDGFAGGPGSTHTAGNGVAFAINNINSAGVDAGSAAGASSVTTGMEIKIPLSVLNYVPGTSIKVTAFINGASHDFVSNQFACPLPSNYGNMGEPTTLNLNSVPGAQYQIFSPAILSPTPSVPAASTWSLIIIALLVTSTATIGVIQMKKGIAAV